MLAPDARRREMAPTPHRRYGSTMLGLPVVLAFIVGFVGGSVFGVFLLAVLIGGSLRADERGKPVDARPATGE